MHDLECHYFVYTIIARTITTIVATSATTNPTETPTAVPAVLLDCWNYKYS